MMTPSNPATVVARDEKMSTKTETPIIALRNIVKSYTMGGVEVLATRSVSLTVPKGQFLAIMGTSGSGKSTLMNIIGCLDVPTSGHYSLDGVNIRTLDDRSLSRIRNTKIGFVFQGFNLIPRMSAIQNVELPMAYANIKPKERRKRAEVAMRMVGLGNRLEHFSNELSGGQQQRVSVARAMATNPALILADEPTGSLDSASSLELMQLFSDLHDHGRTIVMITHEDEVASYGSRVVVLRDGSIVRDELQGKQAVSSSGQANRATPTNDGSEK